MVDEIQKAKVLKAIEGFDPQIVATAVTDRADISKYLAQRATEQNNINTRPNTRATEAIE